MRVRDESDWIELEADSRHAKRILEDYGLSTAKSVATPRQKRIIQDTMMQEDSKLLVGTEATRYRSCTMRAQYMAQYRVDIAEAVNALRRNMSTPRDGHVAEAKRLGRYLKGRDDLVQTLPVHRGSRTTLQVSCHVDSDWAGELVTRRSTSGAVVQIDGLIV